MRFLDRRDAGQALAEKLVAYKGKANVLILALPRGGMPVAYEIARELNLPLDIMLVRKLGVPGYEELAMGAIASGHVQVLNQDVVTSLHISPSLIEQVAAIEYQELVRRDREYRDGRPPPRISDKTVILIDDGMATGANMRAAVDAVRQQQAAHIVVAVPVASYSAYSVVKEVADEVICVDLPEPFLGVGQFYANFMQTSDEEVKVLLAAAEQSLSISEITHGRRRA